MARCLRRRARLGYYDIVGQIDVAVVRGLFVGLCLCAPLQGQTEEQDLDTLRLAAEQGDAEAQDSLGLLHALGQGVSQNMTEAVRLYRLAADQGYAPAQINLGNILSDGRGVPVDEVEAVRFYRLAADQGAAAAQVLRTPIAMPLLRRWTMPREPMRRPSLSSTPLSERRKDESRNLIYGKREILD